MQFCVGPQMWNYARYVSWVDIFQDNARRVDDPKN